MPRRTYASPRRRITLQEVLTRRAAERELQRVRNAARMRRVAARLPACVISPEHCALHNTHEAARAGTPTASTTANL